MLTPLYKVNPRGGGAWRSHDGQFTFLRHESDPHPKRWFVYEGDAEEPLWLAGHVSLSAAVYALTRWYKSGQP